MKMTFKSRIYSVSEIKNKKCARADRLPLTSLQWRQADLRALRLAPRNLRALADSLADSMLAAYNGSASGPASARSRLAGRSSTIVDALRRKKRKEYTHLSPINCPLSLFSIKWQYVPHSTNSFHSHFIIKLRVNAKIGPEYMSILRFWS